MHLTVLVAPAFLATLASAAADADPVTKRWVGPTKATTQTLPVSGSLLVPVLAATASIISATATVSGTAASGQIVLQAAGSGPGVCQQSFRSNSSITDSCGQAYNLMCGYDIWGQGDISAQYAPSWSTCVNFCAQTSGCEAVVYSNFMSICYFKRLSNLIGKIGPALMVNPDRVFAYLPAELPAPFVASAQTAAPMPVQNPGAVSTIGISAGGQIYIPSMTASATIVDASAIVSAGNLLTVKANWMMGGGRR